MCGIAGIWNHRLLSGSQQDVATIAGKMADRLRHRGPDGDGCWSDQNAGIGLSHRRLSIIDLTDRGAQPMSSPSGRFVITYNGEIYNYMELRLALEVEGCRFAGTSDTEVLIAGIEIWGLDTMLGKVIGMFGFAVWDRHLRKLSLVRDRFGIKPLYWARVGGGFVFASQPAAFTEVPGWQGEIDVDAVADYLRFSFVPSPKSIYRNVEKIKPGTILELNNEGKCSVRSYWNTYEVARKSQCDDQIRNVGETVEILDGLIRDAVRRRMVADVPIGAFLSGGIDSTMVVAQMQAVSSTPVRTYTIGFEDSDFNEAEHAKVIAKHLGTLHTEYCLTPQDALEVIPSLPTWFDEPFADSSQIPTYLVSKLAADDVKVVLSGDGGDEVFSGYSRYVAAKALWSENNIRSSLVRRLAGIMGRVPPKLMSAMIMMLPDRVRPAHFTERFRKFRLASSASGPNAFHLALLSRSTDPGEYVIGGAPSPHVLEDENFLNDLHDVVHRMQAVDMCTYLPDDILTKLDRASMAVSLEARVPLLDHRLVSYVLGLPSSIRIRRGGSKWILRELLKRYVPSTLFDRPKQGFSVPVGRWVRGELRDWAEDLLDERAMREDGVLDAERITALWKRHLAGDRGVEDLIWSVLMFQGWKRNNLRLASAAKV